MIIFKCKHEYAWDVNGLQILCTSKNENFDFEVKGNYGENLELLKICIRTAFVNPDKLYKCIFDEAEVVPKGYDEENGGIIDVVNLKIIKKYNYEHNNIVSFCLYGTHPMYFKGALRNIEAYKETYKNVKCYVYVRNDVTEQMVKQMENAGAKVIKCIHNFDWYMMFTRFLPFENENSSFYLSRDTDCRLSKREKKAIEQFMKSDKKFHIIRDHPWHNTLILGGLWGAKQLNLPNLRLIIMQWCLMYLNKNEKKDKGPDQYFLTQMYKLVKDEIYVQDEFFTYEELSEIIDETRENGEYIGEAFDENDEVHDNSLREVLLEKIR